MFWCIFLSSDLCNVYSYYSPLVSANPRPIYCEQQQKSLTSPRESLAIHKQLADHRHELPLSLVPTDRHALSTKPRRSQRESSALPPDPFDRRSEATTRLPYRMEWEEKAYPVQSSMRTALANTSPDAIWQKKVSPSTRSSWEVRLFQTQP